MPEETKTMLCPRCWGSRHEPRQTAPCDYCVGQGSVPDRRLTSHFWLSELLHSDTAAAQGIPNDPTDDQVRNLQRLCVFLLEPIRVKVGPLHVNSGFRSHTLNAVRNGSKNSAHMEAYAADVVPVACTRRQLFDAIRASGLPFDQLIFEMTWIHIGLVGPGGVQRRQVEMAFPGPSGAIKYEPFNPQDPRVAA